METETPTAEDIQLLKKTVETEASQVCISTAHTLTPCKPTVTESLKDPFEERV